MLQRMYLPPLLLKGMGGGENTGLLSTHCSPSSQPIQREKYARPVVAASFLPLFQARIPPRSLDPGHLRQRGSPGP